MGGEESAGSVRGKSEKVAVGSAERLPQRSALQDEAVQFVHRADGSCLARELNEPVGESSGGLLASLDADVHDLTVRRKRFFDVLLIAED